MSHAADSSASLARHLVCLDLPRPLGAAPGDDILGGRAVDNCRRLLMHARMAGWSITHVLDHAARAKRPRAIKGLEPLQIEPVIYRTGVSAFSNRMFRQAVEEAPGAELVLVSLSLSPACLATALAARDRGVAVALVEDALADAGEAAIGVGAILTLSHSIAAPFVRIVRTDDLIDVRRALRVVV